MIFHPSKHPQFKYVFKVFKLCDDENSMYTQTQRENTHIESTD